MNLIKKGGENKETNKLGVVYQCQTATEAQLRKTVKWRHVNHPEGQKEGTYFLYNMLEPECFRN